MCEQIPWGYIIVFGLVYVVGVALAERVGARRRRPQATPRVRPVARGHTRGGDQRV